MKRRRSQGILKDSDPGPLLPKLRALEPIPLQKRGERWIALRDPAGWVEEPYAVPPAFAYLLQYFDGKHTVRDVQKAYADATGEFLFQSNLEKLVAQLDEALLLETSRFEGHRDHLAREYRMAPRRAAAHAGRRYERDEASLSAQVEKCLQEGAAAPGNAGEAAGLVVPHIPLALGGAVYGGAYRWLAGVREIDLAVVLGTRHAGLANGFALTAKDFETPLGDVCVDQDLVNQIAGEIPEVLDEDYAHRNEYTIEMQAVFLRHLSEKKRRPMKILPVLCGFGAGDAQAADPRRIILNFLEVLKGVVMDSGKRTVWIASADLSHLGPRFGDERAVSPSALAEAAKTDSDVLEPVLNGDPEEFLKQISRIQEQHRICGFPVIYALLKLLGPSVGTMIDYAQSPVDEIGSYVSYAGVALTPKK